MKAATLKVAAVVAKETSAGTPGGGNTTPPAAGGGAPVPGSGSTPARNPALSLPAVNPGASTGGQPVSLSTLRQLPAAFIRYALPALLILGGLAALAGTSVLAGAGEGGVLGRLRQLERAVTAFGKSAKNLTGRAGTVWSRLSMDRLTRRGKD
jgi:hypothetical protein